MFVMQTIRPFDFRVLYKKEKKKKKRKEEEGRKKKFLKSF